MLYIYVQKIQCFGTLKDMHLNKEGSKTIFASKCVHIYIHYIHRYIHTYTRQMLKSMRGKPDDEVELMCIS